MSKKHYSENWISPSHGELMIQEIPKYIKAYYERVWYRYSYYDRYGFAEF